MFTFRTLVLVFFAFCAGHLSLAQSTEPWNFVSSLPLPLSDQTADAVGGVIYLTGGCSGNQVCDYGLGFCSCTNITDKVFLFDPATYNFSPLPSMPIPRYRHISCVWRDLIIIVGGRDLQDNILRQVDAFNITARTWTTRKSSLPDDIGSDNGCFTLEDVVYVMGGYNSDYSVSSNATFKYYPGSDTWNKSSAQMIRGRGDLAALDFKGKGYVYGGYQSSDFCTALKYAEVYDPKLDAWLPIASEGAQGETADNSDGVVVAGLILSLGGEAKKTTVNCTDWDITPVTGIYGFNVTANSWKYTDRLPDPRFRFAAAVVNDLLYVFGGQGPLVNKSNVSYFPLLQSVYEFNIHVTLPTAKLPDYWTRLPSLPFSRSDFTTDTVDGLVYIAGGCIAIQRCYTDLGYCGCLQITDDVQVFNPKAGAFRSLTNLPQPRYRHTSCVWQDSIYYFGGRTLSDDIISVVDVFNTSTQTWRVSVTTIPSDIGTDNSCFTIGDTIYIMGGYNSDYSVTFNATYAYNPKANTFTRLSGQLAYGRGDFASAVLNGIGYIYGGYKFDDFCKPLPSGERFDSQTGLWSLLPNLSGETADQRADATTDGRIISIGGERKLHLTGCHDWEIIPSSDIFSYDVNTKQWRNETSMPDARFRFGASVVGEQIYVFGGQGPLINSSNQLLYYPVLSSVYQFDYAQKKAASSGGLSDGQIAGIVIGSIIGAIILIVVIFFIIKSQSGGGFDSAAQTSSSLST